MCRSIKRLRLTSGPAGEDEVREAALQFVRKVSGIRSPSSVTQDSFERAVAEVAESSLRLLEALPPLRPSPRTGSDAGGGASERLAAGARVR